ncbi:MAG TPA: hypothetical protein ENN17_10900, partial [bacterium]|nr:hypothetical protein [bacterium]
MMKRVSLWGLCFILILALACTENITNYYNNLESNGRVIGYIHGVVTDANTNARIDSILVTWIVNGETRTTKTDDLGYYAITKLPPGYYELSFSGDENYAISRTWVTIPDLDDLAVNEIPSDKDFEFSVTADIDLYTLNAGATGRVYAVQHDEQTHPAGGVTVIADFSEIDISPNRYETTANTAGIFSFNNLPASRSMVYFYTLPYSDTSGTYATQWAGTDGLIYNGTKEIDPIFLQVGGAEPFIVRNNFQHGNFGLTDDIIITFSKAMSPETFKIELTTREPQPIGFQATWSNNIVLTINPYPVLQANERYILHLEGLSQDNHFFQGIFDIETVEGIRFVYSNVQEVEGQMFRNHPVSRNIELNFSMPVDLTNPYGYVHLHEGSDSLRVAATVTTADGGRRIVIDPDRDLEPGLLYGVAYKVFSTIEGDYEEGMIIFMAAGDLTVPTQITGFATTTGRRDFDTTVLGFSWNPLSNVDSYYIYAQDNATNTDRVRVGGPYPPQDHLTTATGTVNLPAQFDVFKDDLIQTPFANGVRITFYVVGENNAGLGTFSSGLALGDNVNPTVSFFTQTGNANNIRN